MSMMTWVNRVGGEADELDGQAGEEHVAPDGFVFEEFGDEPFETEGGCFGFEAGDGFLLALGFAGDEDEVGGELKLGFGDAECFGRLRSGAEVEEFVAVGFEDEDGEGFAFGGAVAIGAGFRCSAQEGDGW